MTAFAEIGVTTNFSFLRGASHPKEFVAQAVGYGYAAIGIADRNTLAGVVRAFAAHEELKEQTDVLPKLLIGARLVFVDGTPDILVYPTDRKAYGRLCRLLSEGKLRAPKGECLLTLADLLKWQDGLLLVVMPPHPRRDATTIGLQEKVWNDGLADRDGGPGSIAAETFQSRLRAAPDEIETLLNQLVAIAPDRIWLGVSQHLMGDDARRLAVWRHVALRARVPLLATNDALYHEPARREDESEVGG